MDLCRRSVRVALGRDRLSEIHRLPLPASLKNYLLYQWRWRQSQHTHTQHALVSFSCFSGIRLGLNPFDRIVQTSRTDSTSMLLCLFLILFLWLLAIVSSNFVKSGITELYAHADPDDATTVTLLVYLLQFDVAYLVSTSAVTSRLYDYGFVSCSILNWIVVWWKLNLVQRCFVSIWPQGGITSICTSFKKMRIITWNPNCF